MYYKINMLKLKRIHFMPVLGCVLQNINCNTLKKKYDKKKEGRFIKTSDYSICIVITISDFILYICIYNFFWLGLKKVCMYYKYYKIVILFSIILKEHIYI